MKSSSDNHHERRSELRLDEQATIFIEVMCAGVDDDGSPEIVICNSLDISANGIQVALDEGIAVGSILRLGIQLGKGCETMYLVGEAKWVRQELDQFLVGFELYDAENTDIADWKEAIATFLDNNDQD